MMLVNSDQSSLVWVILKALENNFNVRFFLFIFNVFFKIYLFLIGGELLYNIGFISVIHQHDLAIGLHVPSLFECQIWKTDLGGRR